MTVHTTLTVSRLTAVLAAVSFCYSTAVFANHPVLVEGESDFDGDGLLGVDEDNDSDTDQVFGTIAAALGSANRAANQNGHVIIVTSGRFNEVVSITAENGDVTLQAAPGVQAEIEAVRAGDPDSASRQGAPGIVVNAPSNRHVTIRNIVSRNWTDGIRILGDSRVLIDNCRIEHNVNNNIRATDTSVVAITNSQIVAAGRRQGANLDNTPNPGNGITFEAFSSGTVVNTVVTGSAGAGISNGAVPTSAVRVSNSTVFNNNPNLQ